MFLNPALRKLSSLDLLAETRAFADRNCSNGFHKVCSLASKVKSVLPGWGSWKNFVWALIGNRTSSFHKFNHFLAELLRLALPFWSQSFKEQKDHLDRFQAWVWCCKNLLYYPSSRIHNGSTRICYFFHHIDRSIAPLTKESVSVY